MAKEIQITKREAKVVLGTIAYCEPRFPRTKPQESIKAKVYKKFPDLAPKGGK